MLKRIYALADQLKRILGPQLPQELRTVYRTLLPESVRSHIWSQEFQRRYGDRTLYTIKIEEEKVAFCTKDNYSKHWFFPRYDEAIHEPELTRLFARRAKSCDGIVDVGANLGWFTCIGAAVSQSKVYCFEMDEDNVRRLCMNVKLNEQEELVHIEQAAVTDSVDPVTYWKRRKEASPVYSLSGEGSGNSEQVTVPSTTLDEFFRDRTGSIDLLKIDVEGAELNVLNGGKEVLRQSQPDILVEVHPSRLREMGSTSHDVAEFLIDCGYAITELIEFGGREETKPMEITAPSDFSPTAITTVYATPVSL
jgi:FkbM family methyltransferase